MTNSIFSKDCPTEKTATLIDGVEIKQPAGIISYASCAESVLHKGEQFSREIAKRHFSDFEKDGDRIYYQVSASILDENTYTREITPLKKINDHYPKFIISMDEAPMSEDGIKQINIINFLLQN